MHMLTGKTGPNLFEHANVSMPLLFVEKQIIAVTIPSAFLEGGSGQGEVPIPYTYCEVFAPTELMTKVSDSFPLHISSIQSVDFSLQITGNFVGTAKHTIKIDEDVVSLLSPYATNYYHWITEGVLRLVCIYVVVRYD